MLRPRGKRRKAEKCTAGEALIIIQNKQLYHASAYTNLIAFGNSQNCLQAVTSRQAAPGAKSKYMLRWRPHRLGLQLHRLGSMFLIDRCRAM